MTNSRYKPKSVSVFYSKGNLEELSNMAALAIRHHLYVSGWSLLPRLRQIAARPFEGDEIVLVYCDGFPAAIACLETNNDMVFVFCKKMCRLNGLATMAVNELKKQLPNRKFYGNYGSENGARKFFLKTKLVDTVRLHELKQFNGQRVNRLT